MPINLQARVEQMKRRIAAKAEADRLRRLREACVVRMADELATELQEALSPLCGLPVLVQHEEENAKLSGTVTVTVSGTWPRQITVCTRTQFTSDLCAFVIGFDFDRQEVWLAQGHYPLPQSPHLAIEEAVAIAADAVDAALDA